MQHGIAPHGYHGATTQQFDAREIVCCHNAQRIEDLQQHLALAKQRSEQLRLWLARKESDLTRLRAEVTRCDNLAKVARMQADASWARTQSAEAALMEWETRQWEQQRAYDASVAEVAALRQRVASLSARTEALELDVTALLVREAQAIARATALERDAIAAAAIAADLRTAAATASAHATRMETALASSEAARQDDTCRMHAAMEAMRAENAELSARHEAVVTALQLELERLRQAAQPTRVVTEHTATPEVTWDNPPAEDCGDPDTATSPLLATAAGMATEATAVDESTAMFYLPAGLAGPDETVVTSVAAPVTQAALALPPLLSPSGASTVSPQLSSAFSPARRQLSLSSQIDGDSSAHRSTLERDKTEVSNATAALRNIVLSAEELLHTADACMAPPPRPIVPTTAPHVAPPPRLAHARSPTCFKTARKLAPPAEHRRWRCAKCAFVNEPRHYKYCFFCHATKREDKEWAREQAKKAESTFADAGSDRASV